LNFDGIDGDTPDSQEQESVSIECSNVDHDNYCDGTQVNRLVEEHTSVSEHFLNKNSENFQYRNSSHVERYRCPVCNVPFVSRVLMELHLAEHDGEPPYTCPICKKRFGREGGLKAHLKLHAGEKPHVCEVCNKAFSLKGNLKVHRRLHTGEKPFQCTMCLKAFTQKISLTKHSSIHRPVQ
jgi:KRAB domain-containing zinc finger protein